MYLMFFFLRLLPFSLDELVRGGLLPAGLDELMFTGGYPPVYDRPAAPERWYNAYITTYVERDVRQLVNVRDLGSNRFRPPVSVPIHNVPSCVSWIAVT